MARKTVTVLFADVTGSTEMGERLDPEVLRRVMTRYFEVSRTTLERHGATVEKFIGDAVMAVFGVPAVHEDDAATRGAGSARAAARGRRPSGSSSGSASIPARSSPRKARRSSRVTRSTSPHASSRRRRPERSCSATRRYRVARDAVRTEAVAPVDAKGKSEALVAWRLLDVLDDAPAFTRRIDTPFVGARGRARTARRPPSPAPSRAVSRAAGHRARRARDRQVAPRARARPASRRRGARRGRPLPRLRRGDHVLAARRDRARDRRRGPRRRSLRSRATSSSPTASPPRSGSAASPGRRRRRSGRRGRYLEALAAERPLVVVLDDLHWAEPTFLDLVEYVADFRRGADPAPLHRARRAARRAARVDCAAAERRRARARAARRRGRRRARGRVSTSKTRAAHPRGRPKATRCSSSSSLRCARRAATLRRPADAAGAARGAYRLARSVGADRGRASLGGRPTVPPRRRSSSSRQRTLRQDVGAHLLALVRKEFVRPDRAQLPGDDGYRLRTRPRPRRGIRVDGQGASRRPPRALRALARARCRRPASASSRRSSATTSSRQRVPARARSPGRGRGRPAGGGAARACGYARLRPGRPDRGGEPARPRGLAPPGRRPVAPPGAAAAWRCDDQRGRRDAGHDPRPRAGARGEPPRGRSRSRGERLGAARSRENDERPRRRHRPHRGRDRSTYARDRAARRRARGRLPAPPRAQCRSRQHA